MKTCLELRRILICLLSSAFCLQALAQGTTFTYQGRLNDGANPASGSYDLTFKLFTVSAGGSAAAGPLTNSAAAVNNGLFTVALDFGAGVFSGPAYWLEIGVRSNGIGGFTTLTPRQPLTPTPYAITAENVLNGGIAPGTYGNAVTFNNSGNSFNGAFTGNGAGLTNLTLGGLTSAGFWKTNGNAGANPANGAFLGTSDNLPLELKVNGSRAFRLEPASINNPNVIGGYSGNLMSNGVYGAVIAGGGTTNSPNRVGGLYGAVLGGVGNVAGGSYSTAMGQGTTASGDYSTAMGDACVASGVVATAMGLLNTSSGTGSTAMGAVCKATNAYATAFGNNNTSGGNSSIAAGKSCLATIDYAVAMGYTAAATNTAAVAMGYGTTSGGGASTAMGYYTTATGNSSTTLGAYTTANNTYATAMGNGTSAGGVSSTAMGEGTSASGDYSTAMGYHSAATGGSSVAMGYYCTANLVGSAAMGYNCTAGHYYATAMGFNAQANNVGSFVWSDSSTTPGASSATDNSVTMRAAGGYRLFSNAGGLAGVSLAANANAWSSISDRNSKKNIAVVDCQEVLDKLAMVPVSQWNYKWENDTDVPNLGPMAQDFKSAFYPGRDDKSISTLEFDGVELAAIQGLNQKLEKQRAENAELKARLERLEKLIEGASIQNR